MTEVSGEVCGDAGFTHRPERRRSRQRGACSRGLSGYSLVTADSLESAVELAKGCPVLEIGGAVDVYEAIAM